MVRCYEASRITWVDERGRGVAQGCQLRVMRDKMCFPAVPVVAYRRASMMDRIGSDVRGATVSEPEVLVEAPSSRLGQLRNITGLAPVRRRNVWISCGMLVQLVAVAVPVAWIVVRAKHEAVTGVAMRATVLAAARQSAHTSTGIAIMAGSAVLFAMGSVLVARPFVRSLGMLILAVPLAAIVGVLVLGALALVVAVLIALANAGGGGDLPVGPGTGRGSTTKKPIKAPSDSVLRPQEMGTPWIATGPIVGSSSAACDTPAGVSTSMALGTVPGSTAQIGLLPPGAHTPNE